jgi:yeast amino acid transporter
VWVAVFLTILAAVQIFGVRGYGEVEFVLSIIKVIACTGFIIFAIVVDVGGVPTDTRGYIGAHYWHDPGAFRNGFKGFCSVFVSSAFAFGGTELTGLAAAEAADPRKSIPKATKQVFWRIAFFYVLSTFMLGLIVPSDSDVLLNSSGANTKASPFVLAFKLAGVKGLPSVFNAVITISVISVANSATFGSTRTLQALALQGMGPKIFAYVDKHGRPLTVVLLQLVFGLLAFINEAKGVGTKVFNWLLALSGLSNFFIWGSICIAHIRFRQAWKAQGRELKEIPYHAPFGVWGSAVGAFMNAIFLIAQFYIAVWVSHILFLTLLLCRTRSSAITTENEC